MKAERLAEAAFLRARGQEAAQTLRAIAERQAVEIVASARRDSEILRGEGDAERNSVFASAFGQDPEFFEFYRSMQAYRTALGATGTTMLLSPDSEFFSYFQSDSLSGETPVPAAPNGIPALPNTTLTVPETPDIPIETTIENSPVTIDPVPATPVETAPVEEPAPVEPAPSSELALAQSSNGLLYAAFPEQMKRPATIKSAGLNHSCGCTGLRVCRRTCSLVRSTARVRET